MRHGLEARPRRVVAPGEPAGGQRHHPVATAGGNGEQLAKDVMKVNDAARGKWLSIFGMALR